MSRLSYQDWNEAVGRYIFHEGNARRPIRLAVDPIILQRAAAEGPSPHHFRSPDEAADDFQEVVTSRIKIKSLGWCFGTPRVDKIPYGLAQLALQVLAVFRIEAKEEEEVGSYWRALNGMFGEGHRNGMPKGLTSDVHQSAWEDLAYWANDLNRGRRGILDKPPLSGHTCVRFPRHHGLLRLEDFKALPRFFNHARLTPGEEVESQELEGFLRECAESAKVFPRTHAQRVLQDDRLPLAAVQVANALAQWDGGDSLDLSTERRTVRLWFSVPLREASRVRGGLVEIKPGGDSSDVDNVELHDVLKREGASELHSPVRYRPIRTHPVLAVYSSLDGRYSEARGFDPKDRILIARRCRGESEDKTFEKGLRGIAKGGEVDVVHPDPSLGWPGWVVFQLRVREDVKESELWPLGLAKCLKPPGPRLVVSGGLRFRRNWLEGAGPTLNILRGGESKKVIVDGTEHETVENRLTPERCPALNEVGAHEAWLPGRHHGRVRFRVEPPKRAEFAEPLVQAGWEWRPPPDWPEPLREGGEPSQGRMRGPAVEGHWPPIPPPRPTHAPATQAALKLATALRRPNPARRSATTELANVNSSHPNLLVRQLARALAATGGRRHG